MNCQHDQTKPAPTLRPMYPLYKEPEPVMVWACNVCQCHFRLPLATAHVGAALQSKASDA